MIACTEDNSLLFLYFFGIILEFTCADSNASDAAFTGGAGNSTSVWTYIHSHNNSILRKFASPQS